MDKLKNTYLARLYSKDKLLFAVVIIYLAGILYGVRYQRESFPFFLFGMYSLKEQPHDTYTTYSIEVDGQEIKYSKLRPFQREMIETSLENAVDLMDSHQLTAQDEQAFKAWFMRYCLDMRMAGDSKMDVYGITCRYDDNGKPTVLKKDLLYSYVAR